MVRKKVHFVADYVSGDMSMADFNARMKKYQADETTIMFSSDKLGEGSNVPKINGILSFRAYSIIALWKMVQELGRGTRDVPGEDLLAVDGIFKSEKHEVASMLKIFGVDRYVSGGLVAGYSGERETEMKVFTLLKEGLSWKQIWKKLTEKERELVPFISQYLGNDPTVPGNNDFSGKVPLKNIEFVEHQIGVRTLKDLYPTWQEASIAAKKLGIQKQEEYWKRSKEDLKLPGNPYTVYSNFPGWPTFLRGEEKVEKYKTWQEASRAAIKLKIKSPAQYKLKYKNDPRLPSSPNTYVGFPGYPIFLGTKTDKPYKTWKEAKVAIDRLGITSQADYYARRINDPKLPGNLYEFYREFPGFRVLLKKK